MKKNLIIFNIMICLTVNCVMLGYSSQKEEKVIFYHDGIPGYASTYPSGGLYKVDLKDKKAGIASIRFLWREPKGKWCGGEIAGVHPKDISSFREKGALKFWIKSKEIEESIRVGFSDKNGYAVFEPLKLYVDKVTFEWQKVVMPLVSFKNIGGRWDDALGKKVLKSFCWDQVTGFVIDIGASDGREHIIYLDHIEVVGQ